MEFGFMLMTQSNQVTAACYHLISDTDLHQLSMCISAENKGGSWLSEPAEKWQEAATLGALSSVIK